MPRRHEKFTPWSAVAAAAITRDYNCGASIPTRAYVEGNLGRVKDNACFGPQCNMEGDWDEVTRIPFPPHGHHSLPLVASTIAFDPDYELLWTGNDFGRVMAFTGTELQRYTSFIAHPPDHGPVRQIAVSDRGVIALGTRDLHMALREGPALWHIRHEDMEDLRCITFLSRTYSEVIVAGLQDTMLLVDVQKGEISRRIPTAHHYTMMRRGKYVCAATDSGDINLLNPINLSVVKTWKAHSALINDLDTQNDFLVSCGYSLRQGQNYILDPFLNVFDIKNMVAMPPIPFPAGAAFVRMHPRMLTTSIVMSQMGQMHVVDLLNPNTSNVRQANVISYLGMIEISPSGEAMALVDGDCNIHLWGSPSKIKFVDLPCPLETQPSGKQGPVVEWREDIRFNAIGMPHYREVLLSAWPEMLSDVGAAPVQFDPDYVVTLKEADFGSYGKMMPNMRRNQFQSTRAPEKVAEPGLQAPKFLSEKARESAKRSATSRAAADGDEGNLSNTAAEIDLEDTLIEIPVMYRSVEIKYSKFGVDDFDFGFYNKTPYSGLETHISNAYANSLFQVMNLTPLLRDFALRHTASSCMDDSCLLCELGFLFDMLRKAGGAVCQATNLLKTLSNHPRAGGLGLLEEDAHGTPMSAMLQSLTRFLFDKITQDFRTIPDMANAADKVLAMNATTYVRCMSCLNEISQNKLSFTTDLQYPAATRGQRAPTMTFSQVLKASVEWETTARGWCNQCHRYLPISTRKSIHSIPEVLIINSAISSQDHRSIWAIPDWLPEEVGIIVEQGQFFCYEGEDLKLHLQRATHTIHVYSLVGMVANIESARRNRSHLVAIANVGHSAPQAPGASQWHLFNDFLVCPLTTKEALSFDAYWKLPTVLVFQVKEGNNRSDSEWMMNMDTRLLYQPISPSVKLLTFQPLDPFTEQPGVDTIVALDAEFVAVRQPEIDVNSSGERETIRPIVYALARVSVLRGEGELEGVPFIDDYVAVREPVVDFLTSYSGVTSMDLDPRVSKHNLVSRKVAYKKLWLLLNLGCRFLGHGLRQDFRVINVQIPRHQVIDTINLFYLQTRLRKLSLAFLAWYLLKQDIQQDTHDSIEDARTALQLYRKYSELEDAGILYTILQDVYREGRECNFKPPRRDGTNAPRRRATPPLMRDMNGRALAPSRGEEILQGAGAGFLRALRWVPRRAPSLR